MKLSEIIYVINKKEKVLNEIGEIIGSFDSYSVFEEKKGVLKEKPFGNVLNILTDYLEKFSGKVEIRTTLPLGIKTEIVSKEGVETLSNLNDNACEILKKRGIELGD